MSSATRMEKVTMIDEDRVESFARNVGSKLHDAASNLTGDAAKQARGKANQAAGQAQDLLGRFVDEIGQLTKDKPFRAFLAAVAVGVAFGLITARR